MQVVWKPIPVEGFSDKYEVSNTGFVRNAKSGKVLTPMRTGAKRQSSQRSKIRICTAPRTDVEVGFLVLCAFERAPDEGEQVLHKDDNSSNNDLHNLAWGTQKENMLDCALKKRFFRQKLGIAEVAQIVKERASGVTGAELAKKYGVSQQTICDVYKKRSALAKTL